MENAVHDASVPSFVQNWTTPSTLLQTKRFKKKRDDSLLRPDVLLDHATLFRGFTPPPDATHLIDPFPTSDSLVYAQSICPKMPAWSLGTTDSPFLTVPPYKDKWVVTVVPHGTPTDDAGEAVFERHKENDFYKCFLKTLLEEDCAGAWLFLPLTFFLATNGVGLRKSFLEQYKIVAVNLFEGHTLRYDNCSYVSVCFHRSATRLFEQAVPWSFRGETRLFPIYSYVEWVLCSDLESLPRRGDLHVSRWFVHATPLPDVQVTGLVLNATDGGTLHSRIRMTYEPHRQYGSASSKNVTTLCVKGCVLTPDQQKAVAEEWTLFVEQLRQERWGLFLSALDEKAECSRKRIGYKLSFRITEHILSKLFPK